MSEARRGLLRESVREIIVVVASILIAFALDASWDSSIERRQERDLLEGLLVEFRENQEQLALRISNHERLAAGSREVARLLQDAGASTVTVPDTLLITLMITPTFDPRLGTLEEAQNAGRTNLIRNSELRAALSSWSGQWRDVSEEEQLSGGLVDREFFPAVGRSVSLAHLMGEGSSWINGEPSQRLAGGATAVPVTPGLINFAGQRAQRSRRAAIELADLQTYLLRVIELLEAEVD